MPCGHEKELEAMKREYGDKEGERIFYATQNKEGKSISRAKLAAAWKACKGESREGELMQYMEKSGLEPRPTGFIPGIPLDRQPPQVQGQVAQNIAFMKGWAPESNESPSEKFYREHESELRGTKCPDCGRDVHSNTLTSHGRCRFCGHIFKKAGIAQLPTDYTKQVEGANDFRKSARAILSSMWRKSSPEFEKERKEHPNFSDEQIKQIVADHQKSGKEEGIARFGKEISHGTVPDKIARHAAGSMKEYAELEAAFMKPGDWHTNGIPYHYDWNTIKQAKDSFKKREFFIGHNEMSGAEYGIIKDVEEKQIDGEPWLVGKIRIPETGFTKSALERIENGLTRYVSCMHSFRTDANHNVVRMTGKAIATVLEPEIDGAKILSVIRHIKAG